MNSVLKKDQVYQTLRRQILSGEYKPNEQLPGEFDLAGHFGVSCVTLRSSLRILEEEKLIYRVPRKGTFITPLQQNHNYLIIASSCNAIANPDPYIIQGMEKAAEAAGCGLKTIALEFIRGQSPEYTFELLNKNSIGGVFLWETTTKETKQKFRF